jgi:hypothetical protein
MRIDTEELMVALHEKGIDVDITLKDTRYTVGLSDIENKTSVGIASGETVESALAQIIVKLAENKALLTKLMPQPDGLSIL